MKKLSKLLCAILVFAMLCSSFIFVVGAADEADDAEFTPSVTHTKNDVAESKNLFTNVKAELEGNLYNGASFGNGQSVLSVSNSVAGDDKYITFFANSNGTINQKNPFYQVNTDGAPDISVVSGTSAYYVIDLDVASHGELLPYLDISVMLRRVSDNGGFPFSANIEIASYLKSLGTWEHVTIVGDIAANLVYVYIDGEYKGEGGYAYNADELNGNNKISPKGIRVDFALSNASYDFVAGQNITLDNFAQRVYTDVSLTEGLDAAVASGDLTTWSGYYAGKSGENLPAIAYVNDVAYANLTELSGACISNDYLDVEFVSVPFAPATICANAVIDTNGMNQSKLFSVNAPCEIKSDKDGKITTVAPFVLNYSEENVSIPGQVGVASVLSAIKYDAGDNILNQYVGFSETKNGYLWGTPGYRNASLLNVYDDNNLIYHETTIPAEDGTFTGTNEYVNFKFIKKTMKYEAGKSEYIVADFDFAIGETITDDIALQLIPRNNGSGRWAADLTLKRFEINPGEMVHITVIYDFTNNVGVTFLNGEYHSTLENGAMNATAYTEYQNGASLAVEEYKITSDHKFASIYLDNMYIRAYDIADADNTIDDAVEALDISLWSENIYTDYYVENKMAKFPSIASVDGEYFYNGAAMSEALYGNKKTPVVIKVLRPFTDNVTVACDAIIYTYNQEVNFYDANGNKLVPVDGVINYDAPYVSNRAETNVSVTGNTLVDEITAAIKAEREDNIFLGYYAASAGSDLWGSAGYRNASLVTNVDTGEVFYRESGNGAEGEASELLMESYAVYYDSDANNYVVADFDFATDAVVNDSISFVLVANGLPAGAIAINSLDVTPGEMVHITLVFDVNTNKAYVFQNGMYFATVAGGALDADIYAAYLAGEGVLPESLKIDSEDSQSAFYLDNVAIREFTYGAEDDSLAGALSAKKLGQWDESIFDASEIAGLPTLATVNGVKYGSLELLNKVLATETGSVKSVELFYIPAGAVKITTDTVVDTNGLAVTLDWYTGFYKFTHNDPYQVCTGTNYAYASNKLVCAHNDGENVYTFTTIDTNNCESYATPVVWFNSVDPENVDVVFYIYGDEIKPLDEGVYIQDGKLHSYAFREISYSLAVGDVVESFPVASKELGEVWYLVESTSVDCSFAATDLQYGANISTNVSFTLYVNKSETVTDNGNVVTIGGKDYVAFTYTFAPHQIGESITVTFEVKDAEGNVYEQRQVISFVEYAEELLSGDQPSELKTLVAALLSYANEACALFNDGAKIDSVSALLETYASYVPTTDPADDAVDTSALSSVIRSAALNLNSTPEFIFKVAKGFRGTLQFTYESLNKTVAVGPISVNTSKGEELVVLDGFNIYDACATITITAVSEDGTTVTGQYNLATYAEGLEDNTFALALLAYSEAANAYLN